MRLSEISKLEVIDRKRGEKLGVPGDVDVIFDEKTGKITSLVFPQSPRFLRKKRKEWMIPWKHINRIGDDCIIIDPTHLQ